MAGVDEGVAGVGDGVAEVGEGVAGVEDSVEGVEVDGGAERVASEGEGMGSGATAMSGRVGVGGRSGCEFVSELAERDVEGEGRGVGREGRGNGTARCSTTACSTTFFGSSSSSFVDCGLLSFWVFVSWAASAFSGFSF